MTMTTSDLCKGLLHTALHDPKVMDALRDSGNIGAVLGGMWAKEEEPERARARKKAKPIPVKDMGHQNGSYLTTTFFGDAYIGFCGVTDDGLPVPVTKHMSPYAYSTFVKYDDGTGKGDPRTTCPDLMILHSDKLIRDPRYKKLSHEHFGDGGHYWEQRSSEKIEAFLKEMCEDDSLKLHRILHGCDAGNGYPFWLFKFTIQK